jgi:hypothetical protein
MSFIRGVGSAAGDLFGEALLELPCALLSECDSIEGLVLGVIFYLVVLGIMAILLGMVAVVSEALVAAGLRQLGRK